MTPFSFIPPLYHGIYKKLKKGSILTWKEYVDKFIKENTKNHIDRIKNKVSGQEQS